MSLTTARAALKAHWETQAALIADTGVKLECLMLIERWDLADVALASSEATDITSYSIENISVTRRPASGSSSSAQTVAAIRSQIEEMLYGGHSKVADCRGTGVSL